MQPKKPSEVSFYNLKHKSKMRITLKIPILPNSCKYAIYYQVLAPKILFLELFQDQNIQWPGLVLRKDSSILFGRGSVENFQK